jgi:hypothetical protein
MVGVKFIGGGTLFFNAHAHFFKLLQNKINALIHRHTVSEQAVNCLGNRIILVVAYAIRVKSWRFFIILIENPRRYARRRRP